MQRIYNQIEAADFIIADMTGKNPNVFYEVGYAHAKGKTCILLTANASDIPFDLKHQRHVVYSSIQDLIRKLTADLAFVKEKLHEKGPPITVELTETFALLVKTKWSADAEVTFTFDMHNRTTESSPDIYGIYTGNGWAFTQDNQECPQSSGNSAGLTFKKRHFIKTPIPRLPKAGWAQVRLIGKKTIATAYKGES